MIIKIIASEVKGKDKTKHGDVLGSVVAPIKEGSNRDYQRDIFMGFFVFFFVSLMVYVFNNLLTFYPTSPEYKLSFITFLPGILFASYFFDQAYEKYKSQK